MNWPFSMLFMRWTSANECVSCINIGRPVNKHSHWEQQSKLTSFANDYHVMMANLLKSAIIDLLAKQKINSKLSKPSRTNTISEYTSHFLLCTPSIQTHLILCHRQHRRLREICIVCINYEIFEYDILIKTKKKQFFLFVGKRANAFITVNVKPLSRFNLFSSKQIKCGAGTLLGTVI